jgi:hypothetical protein
MPMLPRDHRHCGCDSVLVCLSVERAFKHSLVCGKTILYLRDLVACVRIQIQ